ncbi:MAG: UbiD family decarboxylase [Dehalococcoidia bacterium]|nr:UbiD family decarboxylase [Dehalococcoidia bacterium]
MPDDLRDFIRKVEQIGECRVVEGVNSKEEIGLITQVAAVTPGAPMLVFDSVKGYPPGYRVASNVFTSRERCALAMGADPGLDARGLVEHWRRRLREPYHPVPPVIVEQAPVKENILLGDNVDLLRFPAPQWHAHDGGRYIGTGCAVIMRDPDEGWVNLGTYRVQVHDRTVATVYISPGKHGDIIRRKYWARGTGCPVVVTCGQDPILTLVATSSETPWGSSEYDEAGWLLGKPVQVTPGPVTGLPVPATAEIALEGEIVSPEVESRSEGPFGEWTGYYASGARAEAAFRVKAIMHRHQPIILGMPPTMNFEASCPGLSYRRSAQRWTALERKIPGVRGVWEMPEAMGYPVVIISLEQLYGGHAKRAALTCLAEEAYMGRWVIVVDEDIDPFNVSEVLWALGTRCDPAGSLDFVRGWWGSHLDAALEPVKRSHGDLTHSVGVILACKPFHWKGEFPPSIKLSPTQVALVKQKWSWLFR